MKRIAFFSCILLLLCTLFCVMGASAEEACSHEWDYYSGKDEEQHWHICTLCGATDGEEMHYRNCYEEVCYFCGQPYTGDVMFHDYESAAGYDDEQHWDVCKDCGDIYWKQDHYRYCRDEDTCAGCNRPYSGDNVTHDFESSAGYDATHHWDICKDCGATDQVSPHYRYCGEEVCVFCDQPYTGDNVYHDFETYAGYDENKHWNVCTICGETEAESNHFRYCNQEVCMYCDNPYTGDNITHDFEKYAGHDAEKHWDVCKDCGETEWEEMHYRYCDEDVCMYCNQPYTGNMIAHEYEYYAGHDAEKHWDVCSRCGDTADEDSHIRYCDEEVCKYCEADYTGDNISHNYEYNAGYDAEKHWNVCSSCGATKGETPHYRYCNEEVCIHCGQPYTGDNVGHDYERYAGYDEDSHWGICINCGEPEKNHEKHYRFCNEDVCYNCRQPYTGDRFIHSTNSELETDDTYHWWVCSFCDEKFDKEEHYRFCDSNECEVCSVAYTGNDIRHYMEYTSSGETHHLETCYECGFSQETEHQRECFDSVCIDCYESYTGDNVLHFFEDGICVDCGAAEVKELKITAQPKSVKVPEGEAAKATVTATGDDLTYLWYYKKVGGSSFIKSAQTKATYSIAMTEARNGYQIYCVITDKYGESVTSDTVTISMATPLAITTQPKSVIVAEGEKAKTTVTAEGDGLTYLWYYKKVGGSSFIKSAQTTKTYSITMTEARNGYQLYCLITDEYGNSVKTSTVTIKMPTPLAITAQPKGVTVAEGAAAKATVTAEGDGLTYLWYYKKVGGSSFIKSAQTKATYSITMTEARNGYQIYCLVKDQHGESVKSKTVTIKMQTPLAITTQPKGVTVAEGATAKATVTAEGDGLTYLWYYKKAGGSSFIKSAQTTKTYSTTMTAARNGYQLYCVITDQYGNSVKTNTVTIKMRTPLAITTQPKTVTVAKGATAKTTVTATGDGLTYLWYYKKAGATSFTKSAQTTKTYSTTMTDARNGYQVYCVVKDKYGNTIKTNTVTLKMK